MLGEPYICIFGVADIVSVKRFGVDDINCEAHELKKS